VRTGACRPQVVGLWHQQQRVALPVGPQNRLDCLLELHVAHLIKCPHLTRQRRWLLLLARETRLLALPKRHEAVCRRRCLDTQRRRDGFALLLARVYQRSRVTAAERRPVESVERRLNAVQREHVPNAGYISSDDTGVSLPEAIAWPDKPDASVSTALKWLLQSSRVPAISVQLSCFYSLSIRYLNS
jgi:hypothetical protein